MEQQGDHIWKHEKQINNPPKTQKTPPPPHKQYAHKSIFFI